MFVLLLSHHLPFSIYYPLSMASTDNPSYDPFFSDPTTTLSQSRRSLASSIWAPQPQATETTWPNAFDRFSRVVNDKEGTQSDLYRPVTKEDVFGPVRVPVASALHRRTIGAVGEGRNQQQSSDIGDLVGLSSTYQSHFLLNRVITSMSSSCFAPSISIHLVLIVNLPRSR